MGSDSSPMIQDIFSLTSILSIKLVPPYFIPRLLLFSKVQNRKVTLIKKQAQFMIGNFACDG